MFGKEYTFESKSTRLSRLRRNTLVGILAIFSLFIIFVFYLIIYAQNKTEESLEKFYQKSPDLIVVFTGYQGRIHKGLEFAQKYKDAKFLISGVYANNSLFKLVKAPELKIELEQNLHKDPINLELDYQSKNTIENVISTLQFLRSDPQLKNVLIVSSDFHLLRINLIFNASKEPEDKFEIFLYGTDTPYDSWTSRKILLTEAIKVIRTIFLVQFWEQN